MAKETETKKTISQEKAKEAKKAAVLKAKEKETEKAKEAKKAAVQKEKEKQKQNLEKEKEKLKEQQKQAINAALDKEREKQKVKQDQAVDKAVLKERARIREMLASGKDPFAKENPLSKQALKKGEEFANAPEEPVEEDKPNPELDSLAKRLGQKKSLDELLKAKEEPKANNEEVKVDDSDEVDEKDLHHVELMRKKREAQMKLNKDEKKDTFDFNPGALQEKVEELETEVKNRDAKIDNLLSELDHKNAEIKELKAQPKATEEPNSNKDQIEALEKEVENRDTKIENLLSELDHKNAEIKELKAQPKEKAPISEKAPKATSKEKEQNKELKKELKAKENKLQKLTNDLEEKKNEIKALKKQANKAAPTKVVDNSEELKNKDKKIDNLLSELDHKNEEIKALQNEINAKDGELSVLSIQLAKLNEELKANPSQAKNQVEATPEVVEIKETGEILIRINVIKEKIAEKNEQIKAVENELDKLSEKDIIDKDFLNEVRRIRMERNSIIDAAQEQLKALAKTVTDNEKVLESDKAQLAVKDEEIAKFNEQLKEKMAYADREQLLYDRSKVIASRDSLAIHIDVLSENCQKYYDRYNREFARLEASVQALDKSEEELIKVYLEKLREEKGGDNADYVNNLEERDALIEELAKLTEEMNARKQDEPIDLVATNTRPVKPDEDEVLVGLRSKLAQIEGKLVKIDEVHTERAQIEKVLRTTDKSVIDYLTLMGSKETVSYMIAEDQKRLDKANVDLRDHPLKAKKSLFGKVKYDPADLENDKKRKDEIKRLESALLENKKKLDDINEQLKSYEFEEKVLFYKKLLLSIEELNSKEEELRKRSSDLKESINSRLEELSK